MVSSSKYRTGPSLAENVTCSEMDYTFDEDSTPFTLVDFVAGMDDFNSGPGVCNFTQSHLLKPSELTRKLPLDVVQASQPMLSCGITNGSTCADQTQMVSEPWAPGLCVLVFWCRDAGPSLAENVTCFEMGTTLLMKKMQRRHIMTMKKTTAHSITLETR